MTPHTLNPAGRLAALRLIEAGLKAAITEAAEQADTYMRAVGADRMRTPWGPLSATTRKPSITWTDEAALIDWCEANAPHVIVRTVPYEMKRWLAANLLTLTDEAVIDNATGEVVTFAEPKPGTTGLTFRPTPEAKDAAVAALLDQLDALAQHALTTGDDQ